MKKHFGIAAIIAALIAVCLFAGCSNSSGGDLPAALQPAGGQEAQKPTLLYWDASKEAFVGSVSWTAKTIEEQVLVTGFVDSVEWRIEPPSGVSELVSWKKTGTFDVDTSNYTITATVQSDSNSWSYLGNWGIIKWSNIPTAKVYVVLNFATGSKTTIATQTGYGIFEWPEDSAYSDRAENYIGKPNPKKTMNPDDRTGLMPFKNCYTSSSVVGFALKVKSAKTYSPEGELVGEQEINWNNVELLQALADCSDSKSYVIDPFFWIRTTYGDFFMDENGVYHTPQNVSYADITLLSGKTIRASF